jgi:hypothetical protein
MTIFLKESVEVKEEGVRNLTSRWRCRLGSQQHEGEVAGGGSGEHLGQQGAGRGRASSGRPERPCRPAGEGAAAAGEGGAAAGEGAVAAGEGAVAAGEGGAAAAAVVVLQRARARRVRVVGGGGTNG